MVNTVELHYKVTRHYNIPHINIVEVFKTLQNDYQKFFAIRQFRSDVFGHLSLLGHRLVAFYVYRLLTYEICSFQQNQSFSYHKSNILNRRVNHNKTLVFDNKYNNSIGLIKPIFIPENVVAKYINADPIHLPAYLWDLYDDYIIYWNGFSIFSDRANKPPGLDYYYYYYYY